MSRNLKHDLETVEKARQFNEVRGWGSKEFHELSPYFSKFHEEGLDIAEYAIKRALEAENIAQELLEILEGIQRLKPLIEYPDDVPVEFEDEAIVIAHMLNKVDSIVAKAREVLK